MDLNKKILEYSTMGILTYKDDGECLHANNAAAEIMGTTVKEIMKLNIYNSVVFRKAGFTQAVKKAFSERLFEYCSVKGFSSSGKELDVFLNIVPFKIGEEKTFLVMIENQLPIKTALREKQKAETISSIINAMTEGLVVHDKNGTIVSANLAFEKIFSKTREELIASNIQELIETFVEKPRLNKLKEKFQKSLQGEPVPPGALSIKGPNGELRYYERAVSYIGTPKEKNFLIVITFKDQTNNYIISEKLKERTRQLEYSNKELEQFAYVASHDLQEPLRMVSSFLQLLSKKYSGNIDETADTYIHYAVDGATRMQSLIQDLLSYSRLDSQGREFASVDCNSLLQKLIDDINVLINEKNALITWENLPVIWADEGQIYSLILNLVQNGIKYSNADPPEIHISASTGNDKWEFAVKDNGIGIDPEFHDRIFMIFQRLHGQDEYSGTGVGLALCKKIVERHKGEIWVESESGKGSSFHFTIPVKKGCLQS